MKNAPAVTARRATKKIVRAPALLVLAAIVETTAPETTAPETTAPETQAAIVVAEQVVRVEIMHLIGLVVMGRQLIDLAATAIGHTRRVPLVMAIDHTRRLSLVTAQPARRGLLVTAPIRRAPRATAIRGRPVPVVTDHTPLVQRATAKLGHAARATTALAFPVVTEIHVHLEPAVQTVPTIRVPLAMVILLVGRRALVETAPIRRAPRATARVQIVREAIVRIARAVIDPMAISRGVIGNPMGESAARSGRR